MEQLRNSNKKKKGKPQMCVLSVGNGNFIVDFCGLSITDTTIMILALQSALLASQFEELKTPKIKENKLYNSGS